MMAHWGKKVTRGDGDFDDEKLTPQKVTTTQLKNKQTTQKYIRYGRDVGIWRCNYSKRNDRHFSGIAPTVVRWNDPFFFFYCSIFLFLYVLFFSWKTSFSSTISSFRRSDFWQCKWNGWQASFHWGNLFSRRFEMLNSKLRVHRTTWISIRIHSKCRCCGAECLAGSEFPLWIIPFFDLILMGLFDDDTYS